MQWSTAANRIEKRELLLDKRRARRATMHVRFNRRALVVLQLVVEIQGQSLAYVLAVSHLIRVPDTASGLFAGWKALRATFRARGRAATSLFPPGSSGRSRSPDN